MAKQLKTQSRQASPTADDPIALFQMWLEQAGASGLKEPTAMTVATVDLDGYPDARLLLLKGVDERGFVFFTNMESPKAQSLLRDSRDGTLLLLDAARPSRSACADAPK